MIEANRGGTPAETWTPAEVVKGDSALERAAAQLPSAEGWPTKPELTYKAMIAP